MQTVTQAFTDLCQAPGRRPLSIFEVRWDGLNYTSESAYLVRHSGTLKLAAPGDELLPPGSMNTATVTLRNTDRRFSWLNEAGALWSYIQPPYGFFGKHVRLQQGFYGDVGYTVVTIFTGIIFNWTDEGDEVTLELRDLGAELVQNKASCPVQEGLSADALIAYYAGLAGIVAGDMQLDPAVEIIPHAWLDDESLLEEMWEVARAVGGQCYFDQLGKLRFENSTHWAGHNVVWALTEGEYTHVRPSYTPDLLITKVVVEWSARVVAAENVVYTLNEAKIVKPGETLVFEARFNNPLYQYTELTSDDYYVISIGGMPQGSATVEVTLPLAGRQAQRCQVQVVNSHTTLAVALIKLEIKGLPLVGGPNEEDVILSVRPPYPGDDPYDVLPPRVRTARANMYVQTVTQAKALAAMLTARNGVLIPTWTLSGVPGFPHLEPGDKVSFQAADTITTNRNGFIVQIDWTGGNAGFMQTITLIDAVSMFPYTDYYVIGTTALGQHGKAWF